MNNLAAVFNRIDFFIITLLLFLKFCYGRILNIPFLEYKKNPFPER